MMQEIDTHSLWLYIEQPNSTNCRKLVTLILALKKLDESSSSTLPTSLREKRKKSREVTLNPYHRVDKTKTIHNHSLLREAIK